jgi:hypothetical protein
LSKPCCRASRDGVRLEHDRANRATGMLPPRETLQIANGTANGREDNYVAGRGDRVRKVADGIGAAP